MLRHSTKSSLRSSLYIVRFLSRTQQAAPALCLVLCCTLHTSPRSTINNLRHHVQVASYHRRSMPPHLRHPIARHYHLCTSDRRHSHHESHAHQPDRYPPLLVDVWNFRSLCAGRASGGNRSRLVFQEGNRIQDCNDHEPGRWDQLRLRRNA